MRSAIVNNDDGYEDAPADVERALDIADKNNAFMSLDELLARIKKKRVTLNIDGDVLDEYRVIASKNNVGYQPLMNEALRDALRGYTKKRLPASK